MPHRISPEFQRLSWANLLAQAAEQLSLAAAPLLAVLVLNAGPGEVGLLASVQSLPFLLLAIPLRLLADRSSRRTLMVVAEILRALALLLLVAALVMAITLLVPQGPLAGLSFWLFGFGPIIWVITSTTLRQTVTPQRMMGRVGSINMVVSSGARPLGAALGGLIGSQWGEAAALSAVVACFFVQLLIILASPVRTLQRLPEPAGD